MDRINKWYKRVLINELVYKQVPKNSYKIPKLNKITLKSSFNSVTEDPKNIVFSYVVLEIIAKQKPKICLATKSISSFKLQKNTPLACKQTLRKIKKDLLLNLLITVVLPRVQNFSPLEISKNGVLNIGLKQLSLFPQLTNKYEQIPRDLGLTVTFDNSRIKQKDFRLLLTGFQLPIQ